MTESAVAQTCARESTYMEPPYDLRPHGGVYRPTALRPTDDSKCVAFGASSTEPHGSPVGHRLDRSVAMVVAHELLKILTFLQLPLLVSRD